MQWVDVDDSDAHEQPDLPAGTALYYRVHYHVHKFIFNVDWWMAFFHTLKRGTIQYPEKVLINYQKTDGTSHIQYWVGTIVLEKVTDEITSYAIHTNVNADQRGPEDQGRTVSQVHAKLKTGDPEWDSLPKGDAAADPDGSDPLVP